MYKAYDVPEMREVACKLHQLNPQWSEQRKVTYVKHAARECEIHKQLRHPSVVQLIDVFEVDQNCFCTVLELCTGDDLDARLKAQGAVSEREARAILAQVFAGLAYMNSGSSTVSIWDEGDGVDDPRRHHLPRHVHGHLPWAGGGPSSDPRPARRDALRSFFEYLN